MDSSQSGTRCINYQDPQSDLLDDIMAACVSCDTIDAMLDSLPVWEIEMLTKALRKQELREANKRVGKL